MVPPGRLGHPSCRTANGTCGVSPPEAYVCVLVIDTYEDLECVVERWPDSRRNASSTSRGLDRFGVRRGSTSATRASIGRAWTVPLNLYGWDCETTLWLRVGVQEGSANCANFPVKNDDC